MRGRPFAIGYCAYLLLVIATFTFGTAHIDSDGVVFIPCFFLTIPWCFAITTVDLPRPLYDVLVAFYDLPLFLLSAALNIFVVELVRRLLAARSKAHPATRSPGSSS
jgi:hypothetical protein